MIPWWVGLLLLVAGVVVGFMGLMLLVISSRNPGEG